MKTPFSNSFAVRAAAAATAAADVAQRSALHIVPFDPAQPAEDLAGLTWNAVPAEAVRQAEAENPLAKYLVKPTADYVPTKSVQFAVGAGAHGQFPMGAVAVLAGAGGGAKTATAISLAVAMAGGSPFGAQTRPGGVLLVSFEDDADEMQRRIHATADCIYGTAGTGAELFDRIRILPLAGTGVLFTKREQYGAIAQTLLADYIADICDGLAAEAGCPVGLVVVDHARLAMAGDPNESEAASAFTAVLTRLAKRTGAAVLLLCHTPKASRKVDHASDYSASDVLGSGAFSDNARFVMLATPMTTGEAKTYGLDGTLAKSYLALRTVKSNYSRAGRTQFLRKVCPPGWDAMVPMPVEMGSPMAPRPSARPGTAGLILEHVRANPGRMTRRRIASMAGVNGPLRAREGLVRTALDELLESGQLILRAPTHNEMTGTGLRKNDQVLDLVQGAGGAA